MILTFGGLAKEPAFQKGSVIKNDLKKAEVGRLGTAKRLLTVSVTTLRASLGLKKVLENGFLGPWLPQF